MGTLQLKRLTSADRVLYTPLLGEPVYDLTNKAFYVGDGVTLGGLLTPNLSALIPNVSNTTLSGTPKVFTLYDGATPYYIKAYPTKV